MWTEGQRWREVKRGREKNRGEERWTEGGVSFTPPPPLPTHDVVHVLGAQQHKDLHTYCQLSQVPV